MKAKLYLATIAAVFGLAGCTKVAPEPDYSGMQHLNYTITQASSSTTGASQVMVYPNPFIDQVTVDIYASVPKTAHIYLSDEKGKYSKKIPLEVTGSASLNVYFKDMPKGIYLCEVEMEGKSRLFRLIKNQ